MLATVKPRQTERPKPPTQEQIRRQPGRKAWVPNQHGAWSADAASGLVGEPAGAGESADPAAGVGRGGSVCAEGCSTWCLDGLDGRDWLTPSP